MASDAVGSSGVRASPSLHPVLVGRLRSLGSRLRVALLLEGAAWTAGVLVASGAVQFALDYGSRGLRWSMRAALLAFVMVGVFRVVWRRVIGALRIRIGLAECAQLLERSHPQLSSLLISAVQFSAGQVGRAESNSPVLMASTVERAGREAQALDARSVVDLTRARRAGCALVAMLALGTGAFLTSPAICKLWFARNILLSDVDWPRHTRLIVETRNGEIVGARGDDLVIEARAEGVQPREVEFYFETASGAAGRETMVTIGSIGSYKYRYTFKSAQEDFDFYLDGGDDRTRTYRVRLLDRPHVDRLETRIVPPAYARLEASVLGDDQRSASFLPGSAVTLHIHTSKPVVRATLLAGNDPVAEALPTAPSTSERSAGAGEVPAAATEFHLTFSPQETRTYAFTLVDEVGLQSVQPTRFTLRILKDEPPRVRVRLDGVGAMVTTDAVLPVELEFADTYGLASAQLQYQTSREGAPGGEVEIPGFTPYATTFTTSLNWLVSRASVSAGERLALLARAADFDDVSGPNVAQSAELALRIVTREELLAELARREQEARGELERLIDVQEQVRGKLLSELDGIQRGVSTSELAARVTSVERRQRTIAGSVNVLRQQFEQILAELRVNQLATNAAEQRLGGAIIEPLGRLAKRDLVLAADNIRQWGRDPSPAAGRELDAQQAEILRQMREILANMLQWEGYQEAVNMLRDILRIQAELEAETRRNLEQQGSDLFDK